MRPGGAASRADVYGNVGGAYFNPLAFAPVTTPSFGTVAPYSMRGPGAVNMDLSLSRSFRVKERYTIQFRADSFNFTNTPHFANPGGNVSNLVLNPDGSVKNLAGFAQVTAIATNARDGIDERQFRFTLRISFETTRRDACLHGRRPGWAIGSRRQNNQ
jgi:hypothetical protein